jgi:phosphoribosyl 1,2-cyclic phosphate phosphodiesterase
MDFVFLGTGAGCGVPAFYCGCKACQEALNNSHFRRTRCAIVLTGEENLLIDAPPELSTQLSREDVKKIDYFALTHSHYDHIGGLGDLEFYVRLHRNKALPAVMSHETWMQLQTIFGSVAECLDVKLIEPSQVATFGEVHITALEAAHSSGTLGFLIEHNGTCIAYMPDTGSLPAKTWERLHGIDYLILDATFWGRNWYPGQHLSFDEAIAIGRELEVQSLYLTHLSMHYDTPVTNQELEEALKPYQKQVHLAYDGLRFAVVHQEDDRIVTMKIEPPVQTKTESS